VPAAPGYLAVHRAIQDVAIQDLQTSRLAVEVGDGRPLDTVRIVVDIDHTYIGDLVVRVIPPPTSGAGPVILHSRIGGGTRNLKTTFDATNAGGLGTLAGKNPKGTWTLEVEDQERVDTGTIRSFGVELTFR